VSGDDLAFIGNAHRSVEAKTTSSRGTRS
jgi:hypothetical protein